MKVGWTKQIVDDVCQFRGGGTPSKAVDRYWQGDIPWVSPKDMKFDVVTDSIDHISVEATRAKPWPFLTAWKADGEAWAGEP